MKVLRSAIAHTTRKGTWQWAVLESLEIGLATVRLGKKGNGPRLSNLNIVGNTEPGNVVIVDYSAKKPYVRTLFLDEVEVLEEVEQPIEWIGEDCICQPPATIVIDKFFPHRWVWGLQKLPNENAFIFDYWSDNYDNSVAPPISGPDRIVKVTKVGDEYQWEVLFDEDLAGYRLNIINSWNENPTTGERIVANRSGNSLWYSYSDDGGQTWVDFTSTLTISKVSGNGQVFYRGELNNNFYRVSYDMGQTWQTITPKDGWRVERNVAVSETGQIVYALIDDRAAWAERQYELAVSTDHGATWSYYSKPSSGAIYCNLSGDTAMFCTSDSGQDPGAHGIYKVSNYGATIRMVQDGYFAINDTPYENTYSQAGFWCINYEMSAQGIWLAPIYSGYYRDKDTNEIVSGTAWITHYYYSLDNGETWDLLDLPVRPSVGRDWMLATYVDNDLWLMGDALLVLKTPDWGNTWEPMWAEYDPYDTSREAAVWQETNYYCFVKMNCETIVMIYNYGNWEYNLILSTDGGETFRLTPLTGARDAVISGDGEKILVSIRERAGWRDTITHLMLSTDQGETWEDIAPLKGQRVTDEYRIAASEDFSRILVGRATGDGETWLSTNLGQTWTEMGPFPAANMSLPTIVGVSGDGSTLFVHIHRASPQVRDLWYSNNNGQSWTKFREAGDGSPEAGFIKFSYNGNQILFWAGSGQGYSIYDISLDTYTIIEGPDDWHDGTNANNDLSVILTSGEYFWKYEGGEWTQIPTDTNYEKYYAYASSRYVAFDSKTGAWIITKDYYPWMHGGNIEGMSGGTSQGPPIFLDPHYGV
jgi:hypothetical protein